MERLDQASMQFNKQGRSVEISVDGETIRTERDFHRAFSSAAGIGNFYGENLPALWDVLSAGIERPVTLIWTKSDRSKEALGPAFEAIVDVFRRVEMQDLKFGWVDRFSFVLA